jgi:hypothetical protein
MTKRRRINRQQATAKTVVENGILKKIKVKKEKAAEQPDPMGILTLARAIIQDVSFPVCSRWTHTYESR